MNKFLIIFLFVFVFLNLSNYAISPTIATIEPIVTENIDYLSSPKSKFDYAGKEYWTIITAYSSNYDETDNSPYLTASGSWVEDGVVASNFLPFGTKLIIPDLFGNKIFIVKDRMHERFNDRVDVWFPTKWEAIQFGIQYGRIVVLPY